MTPGAIRYVVFIWCTSFLILPLLFFDVWQNSQFVKRLTAVRIIYSPHIHRAFHFAQLSLRTAYEFSILRGRGGGQQKHSSAPPSAVSHTALALQGGNSTASEYIWAPPPHIAPPSNCTEHLGPFFMTPFPKAILPVWTPCTGYSTKDQAMTSSKTLAFNAQKRQLERLEQPTAPYT